MRAALMLVPLLFAAVMLVPAAVAADGGIVQLKDADHFREVAWGRGKSALVLFCAPWAKRKCTPAREALATAAASVGTKFDDVGGIVFSELDAHAHRAIASNYTVSTLPSLMLFAHVHSARVSLYGGDANHADEILEWAHETLTRHERFKTSESAVHAKREATRNNFDHPSPGKVVRLETEDEFRRITGDSAKTVLVAFVAPWCQHCKELAPVLDELADFFKGDRKSVIATVNGDDLPTLTAEMKVEGFPTIRVFPKGVHAKGRGMLHRGDRALFALKNLMEAHNSNVPIDGVDYPFNPDEDDEL